MEVNAVNMDWIAKEANRIDKEKKERSSGDFPPLNWYNIVMGDTIVRFMPPWSTTGVPFWRQSKHWDVPPEKTRAYCLTQTWPKKAELCYHCDELDQIVAQFPDKSVGRQRASSQYLANAVIRECPKEGTKLEEKGSHIITLTDGMYNWLIEQLKNPKIGPLVFDVEKGCDLKITKSQSTRKDGKKQTKYAMTFMPGVSALHEDPKVIEEWCSKIVELDKIIKYPNDEDLIKAKAQASQMGAWFLRRFRDDQAADDSDDQKEDEVVVGSAESRVDESSPSEAEKTAEKSVELKKQPVKSDKMKSMQEEAPGDEFPACFAGYDKPVAHEDGSLGFNEELEKCMLCPHEMRCTAAKEQKGI